MLSCAVTAMILVLLVLPASEVLPPQISFQPRSPYLACRCPWMSSSSGRTVYNGSVTSPVRLLMYARCGCANFAPSRVGLHALHQSQRRAYPPGRLHRERLLLVHGASLSLAASHWTIPDSSPELYRYRSYCRYNYDPSQRHLGGSVPREAHRAGVSSRGVSTSRRDGRYCKVVEGGEGYGMGKQCGWALERHWCSMRGATGSLCHNPLRSH